MRVRGQSIVNRKLTGNEADFGPPVQVYVTPGKEYTVYALSVYDGVTFVQIVDDSYTPAFWPRCFFDVIESSIPPDWVCSIWSEGPIQCVLGPEHVAKDQESYGQMADCDASQIERFWSRIDAGHMPAP